MEVDTGRLSGQRVLEVWARSKHFTREAYVQSFLFSRLEWKRRFPGVLHKALLHCYMYVLRILCTERSQAVPRRQTTFVPSALMRAQTTDVDNNRRSAESYQLATKLHDVPYCSQLLLADPGIRHRGYSWECELLTLCCV